MSEVWTLEWVISFGISNFSLLYFGFWNLFEKYVQVMLRKSLPISKV